MGFFDALTRRSQRVRRLHFACSATTLVPLVALLAATVSAIVLAAQFGLAFCNNRVALATPTDMMRSMHGMQMPGMDEHGGLQAAMAGHALMICPVVLLLITASALLAAAAIVVLWLDPHRALTRRAILRRLSSLPLGRTACSLASAGALAVFAMLALDGAGTPALPTCGLLAVLLAGCSLGAVVVSIVAGRVAIALGVRLVLAVAAALARFAGDAAPRVWRLAPVVRGMQGARLLAAGRGLRAPPSPVR